MTIVVGAAKRHLKSFFDNHKGGVSENVKVLQTIQPVSLMRPECETMESFVHFVTYAVLRDPSTKEIFYYQRGKKGTEARLHGDYSVGVGGHVEKFGPIEDITTLIARTFQQELKEEVSLELSDQELEALILKIKGDSPGAFLIYDDSNPVGKVHLGVSIIIDVDKARIGDLEDGTLLNHGWIKPRTMFLEHEAKTVNLENWSMFMCLTVDTMDVAQAISTMQIKKK